MNAMRTRLRRALRANAAFSGASGAVLVALHDVWPQLFGLEVPILYGGLGAALVLFAAVVAWVARDPTVRRPVVVGIVAADAAWVLATPVAMAVGHERIAAPGHLLLIATAAVVATLAWLQWHGLRAIDARGSARA